jgi:hypothetical protein
MMALLDMGLLAPLALGGLFAAWPRIEKKIIIIKNN